MISTLEPVSLNHDIQFTPVIILVFQGQKYPFRYSVAIFGVVSAYFLGKGYFVACTQHNRHPSVRECQRSIQCSL